MADEPSRLSDGMIYYKGGYIPIAEYRDIIFARSLYSLDNEYKNTNKFSLNNKGNVASSISTVLTVIPQYNRMQVNTNLLGNVYDAFRDEGSALAKIGLIMLGKQMAYNSAMNLAVKYVPTINLSQALKGNPDKIFKFNKDNTITIKNKEDKTFLDKIGSVGSNVFGIDTYDVFGDANPFSKNPTNSDYIKNTGTAQLTNFFTNINRNLYKPINTKRPNETALIREKSDETGTLLNNPLATLESNNNTSIPRIFFNFNNYKSKPYFRRSLINAESAGVVANEAMLLSYNYNNNNVQEYAPYYQYIVDNFGKVVKLIPKQDINNWVGIQSNFTEDNSKNNLVWGRDGVGAEAETQIKNLRGDVDAWNNTPDSEILNGETTTIRTGLLEYTRNLLNASEGNFVDITRKVFKDGKEYVGYNGSPLWKGNDTTYSNASGTANKAGVRQHTILDQYGSDTTELNGIPQGFAKSIRFKGNVVYNGNENSVIYKTVLPRIHPTRNENGNDINKKNLMFSIENLAIGTVKRDKFGVIDDEDGTPIPLSEVGPFAGRMMWFPPYNIEINEVAIAKYESTVMVGRNEPMYNYMNSERTAVLSFTLLVDYPEQLRNINFKGNNKNKAIADFFAFGGNSLPPESQIEVIEEKINKLNFELETENGPVDQAEPANIKVDDVIIYFPNDKPTTGEINTIINTMYNNEANDGLHYEIIDGLESAQDGNGFGLNEFIYYYTGLTAITTTTLELIGGPYDQYSLVSPIDQFGNDSDLNKNLLDVYGDEGTRKYYDIKIVGTTSLLYLNDNEKEYNDALGNRRVAAAKKLIVSKLTAMFGATVANEIANNNIKTVLNVGSTDGSVAGAEADNMHLKDVKKERRASISFARDTIPVDKKEQNLNTQQKENRLKIQQDIQALELQLSIEKNNIKENIYNERNKAILNSFESISDNQFYPVFHSQTPEDFHRRLTFLQQCTRQGAAKRYDILDENTGELRARNSVFGKQPICILRIADFFYTKVVIESVTIDYAETTWDMNPEGFGMQPMIANITLNMKVIGGQSLKGPIDALQNAVTFNYYANSTFTDKGMYKKPSQVATDQNQYMFGIKSKGGIVGEKKDKLIKVSEGEE